MKKSIALLCFALSIGVTSAAHAGNDSGIFCTQLSSDLAAQSALFTRVADAAPESIEDLPSAPAALRQRVHNREVVLHSIANEIWSLRTRMAYLDCAQAKTFAY